MSKKLKIMVACGSGVAPSTVASKTVEDVCKEYGIEASIDTCSMRSVADEARGCDAVLTTNKYEGELNCPVMSVTPFITGIRVSKKKEELGKFLTEIAND